MTEADESWQLLTRVISEIAGNLPLLYTNHAFEAADPLFELMHDIVVYQMKLREQGFTRETGVK